MHQRRLRIAQFCQRYPPAPGGSEAYAGRLCEYLVDKGHQVTVFTSTADELEAFWDHSASQLAPGRSLRNGVTIHRYPLRHFPLHRLLLRALSRVPGHTWRCRFAAHNPILPQMWADAHASGERFDVIHALAFPYGWPLICGLRWSDREGIPFLLTPFVHTGDPENEYDRTRMGYTRSHLLYLAQAAAVVFVQTEIEREVLAHHGIDGSKMVLQGMGVDTDSCTGGSKERAISRWSIGPGPVVGQLANKSWDKGTVDLLKAAEIAWKRGAKLQLLLAGPEMASFRDYWNDYPLKERVICLPRLSEEEKKDFFAAIDVFALPSRSDSFGIVLLEAWVNDAATIGYRAGGIPGVIRHEENGILVPCGNVEALAEAMERLCNEESLRARLAQAGRECALRDYRWEEKLALVERVMLETIAERE